MKQSNVLEQVQKFLKGDFASKETNVQCEAGWYDWFCRRESLSTKTLQLYKKVIAILKANEKGKRFDPTTTYVFFKNNCPGIGKNYDSISFCDTTTGKVIFWVTPKSGHTRDNGEAQVSGLDCFLDYKAHGKWKNIIDYFKGKEA